MRYQSLIHHEGERYQEDVTDVNGEEDEMPYVIMPDNTFGKNSRSPERDQQNGSTHESYEGQQEHHTVDEAKTKKTEKAEVDTSDEYFTPLVRLPENTHSDFLGCQSLNYKGKSIDGADAMTKEMGENGDVVVMDDHSTCNTNFE